MFCFPNYHCCLHSRTKKICMKFQIYPICPDDSSFALQIHFYPLVPTLYPRRLMPKTCIAWVTLPSSWHSDMANGSSMGSVIEGIYFSPPCCGHCWCYAQMIISACPFPSFCVLSFCQLIAVTLFRKLLWGYQSHIPIIGRELAVSRSSCPPEIRQQCERMKAQLPCLEVRQTLGCDFTPEEPMGFSCGWDFA